MKAVLLDAFGTLVTLDAPAPLLRALLAERLGLAVTDAQASRALAAEVAHYRAHMHEGVDAVAVAQLHARCAEVLRQELAALAPGEERLGAAPVGLLTEVLLESLRFRVFDDAEPALARLRAAGAALVVVSNWDASLERVLERAGLLRLLDGVITSAAAGYAKPDPRLLWDGVSLAATALVHAATARVPRRRRSLRGSS